MYGPAFNIAAAEVYTYLGKFMPGNSITDLKRLYLSEYNNRNMKIKLTGSLSQASGQAITEHTEQMK